MDAIDGRDDLTQLSALIDVAGLRDTLTDPAASLTLFAPDDDAFEALLGSPDAPDVDDPDAVRELLLAHVNTDLVLTSDVVLTLTEVEVANGAPQPVDPGPPPTVGGAEIVEADVTADNGVIHVVDTVFQIRS
jgi:uncharacterized surface protein with fasciclin (FAS1) repeats